ncbi:MAG: 3'-5' exonuclease [Elusimicrobiota bacterium]|jgi:DNA polymerase-3 subunit epsilon
MKLTRPIIFLDLEATGADPQRDRIVEIALIRQDPDQSRKELIQRINPGVRIPLEAIAIHGIRNEDVTNAPSFKEVAASLLTFMEGCDLGGFGITRFDIPLLTEEFKRCNLTLPLEDRALLDGLAIYHQRERRDLSAAYQFYCQKTLEGAHGARADALASLEVFFAQLQRYPDLPQDTEGLHAYCNRQDERFVDNHRKFIWRDGEAAFNFGKYKGELLRNMVRQQPDYIQWIVSDGKFSQEVVDLCWKALKGEFPSKR